MIPSDFVSLSHSLDKYLAQRRKRLSKGLNNSTVGRVAAKQGAERQRHEPPGHPHVVVTILGVNGSQVRIGIDAPGIVSKLQRQNRFGPIGERTGDLVWPISQA
jgi:hypothetical protein